MTKRKRVEAWAVVVDSAAEPLREVFLTRDQAERALPVYRMARGHIVHLTSRTPAEARELRALRGLYAYCLGYSSGDHSAHARTLGELCAAVQRAGKGKGR